MLVLPGHLSFSLCRAKINVAECGQAEVLFKEEGISRRDQNLRLQQFFLTATVPVGVLFFFFFFFANHYVSNLTGRS